VTSRLISGANRWTTRKMSPISISRADARRIWLHAQRLDEREPFGAGQGAVPTAIEHLGYVQIDTINVIERCHHHILFSRFVLDHRASRSRRCDNALVEPPDRAL
jgi:uncharacterized protein YcaQ